MVRRNIEPSLAAATADTPVVLINGARQTGKTTLVQTFAARPELPINSEPSTYVTLDDASVLAAAASDPHGFVEEFEGPVIIDEVQKAPQLFPAIKMSVDRDRRPGRFLLTGSANVLMLPRLSESLAGRMEIITLRPLSQGEQDGRCETFVDRLMDGGRWRAPAREMSRQEFAGRVSRGGYPEAVQRIDLKRRRSWFASYLTTILQRDIRDLSNIEGLTNAPRLMALLAARSGGLLNVAEVSRSAGVPHTTLQRYLALFEATFLIHRVRPWTANLGKRLVKSPKLLLGDTGFMTYLLGASEATVLEDMVLAGRFVETFVGCELLKQIEWSESRPALLHYRTASGTEVDYVLEEGARRVAGIEVKLSRTIRKEDLRGLRSLAEDAGSRFVGGILLYTGDLCIPFGNNLWALPMGCLWE
ncbi:MAG: ATP-binding protein [Spirochaetales bacterium]|nr:ATP-binding protein [Spirochaetales bacterium]